MEGREAAVNSEPSKERRKKADPRRLAILFFILVPAAIIAGIMAVRQLSGRENTQTAPAAEEILPTAGTEPESANITLSEEPEPETDGTPEGMEFTRDLPPEIPALFEGYFKAKLSGDACLADSYFYGEEASDYEAESQRLLWSMKYIEDYRDIACYGIPGQEPDSYVVYVAYKMKFYQSEVPAPSMSAAYVKKDEDGIYKIYEEGTDEAVKQYMEQAAMLDSAMALAAQVQKEFLDALAEDESLTKLYELAMSGPAADGSEAAEEEISSEPS